MKEPVDQEEAAGIEGAIDCKHVFSKDDRLSQSPGIEVSTLSLSLSLAFSIAV